MTRQNLPPTGSFAAAAARHHALLFDFLSNKINILSSKYGVAQPSHG
jgi:hypothetical protein